MNPADSGEGGVWLVLFAQPWLGFLPMDWVAPGSALACILVNALVVYYPFGGLGIKNSR